MFNSPFTVDPKNRVQNSQTENTISWETYCRKLPLVCGLKTLNAEMTIYACLQQAYKQFDHVIITDDGSDDKTLEMIKKCTRDFDIRNVSFADVSSYDPWPDQVIEKKEGDHHIPRKSGKTHAKAQHKNLQAVKQLAPNCIYVSLEDDVILFDNIRQRIYDRISRWEDPYTDCEFFNVSSIVDRNHTLLAIHEGKPLPGIRQRALYDNAGDWTCAAIWSQGQLQIGPDPVYAFGACLFPWTQKNQCGKKGQDNEMPFGFHMLNYRTSKEGFTYELNDPGLVRIDSLSEDSCGVDFEVLDRVWFPSKIKLEKTATKWIQKIEVTR